jgi:branched-chain amino acid transport system permease protein
MQTTATESSRSHLKAILVGRAVTIALGVILLAIYFLHYQGSLFQYLTNGIIAGSIYGLTALGFTIVFRTVKYFDLGYSIYPAVGAYAFLMVEPDGPFGTTLLDIAIALGVLAALAAGLLLGSWTRIYLNKDNLSVRNGIVLVLLAALLAFFLNAKVPTLVLPLASLLAALSAGILSTAIYKIVYSPLHSASRSPLSMIVSSLGVMLMLQALLALVFTVRPRVVPIPEWDTMLTIGGAYLRTSHVIQLCIVASIFLGTMSLFYYTNFGKAARAVANDEVLARVAGINSSHVKALLFFLSGAIGAVVGILVALDVGTVDPRIGFMPLFKGWIAAVIGGVGSLPGALVGGLVLGLIENLAIGIIPAVWKDTCAFVIFILFLLLRPRQGVIT